MKRNKIQGCALKRTNPCSEVQMNRRTYGIFSQKLAIGIAAFAGLGIGTIAVYRLLERSGESAIRMIPADAALVISLDTSPSPSQVRLYNEISMSMKDSGINDFVDEILNQVDGGQGSLKAIRDQVKGSFAAGVWGDLSGNSPDWVTAVALSNPGKAETLVAGAAGIRATNEKGRMFYSAKDAPALITFFGDYALISNRPESAFRAISVANGDAKSVYMSNAFQEARASLPNDAGLMVFLNGKSLAELDEHARQGFRAMGVDENGWFALGGTLREEGILIHCSAPSGSGGAPAAMRQMSALTFAALEAYPSGAIGVAGVSSPAGWYNVIRQAVKTQPDGIAELEKEIQKIEQEIGLSLDRDILPGLRGEVNMAFYAPKDGGDEPRFLLTIDNQHGGQATTLAKKVISQMRAGKMGGPTITETAEGDWTYYAVAGEDAHLAVGKDMVILSSDQPLLNQVASRSGKSLLYSDAFRNLADSGNAKFRIQVDAQQLVKVIEEEGGDSQMLSQALTGRPLSMSWTADSSSCRAEIMIPVNVPELIRMGGKMLGGFTGPPGMPGEIMGTHAIPPAGEAKRGSKAKIGK